MFFLIIRLTRCNEVTEEFVTVLFLLPHIEKKLLPTNTSRISCNVSSRWKNRNRSVSDPAPLLCGSTSVQMWHLFSCRNRINEQWWLETTKFQCKSGFWIKINTKYNVIDISFFRVKQDQLFFRKDHTHTAIKTGNENKYSGQILIYTQPRTLKACKSFSSASFLEHTAVCLFHPAHICA